MNTFPHPNTLDPMVELNSPQMRFVESYLEFIDEMRQLGETVWDGMVPVLRETKAAFIERLIAAEINPAPALVPQTTYWATKGVSVVGRIALRHGLNETLMEFGGHIGYEVRPSARRQGIAQEMLRRVLATPKAREIGRLLLTCAPDNIASNKMIRANGGILEKTAFLNRYQRNTNYYWIDVTER